MDRKRRESDHRRQEWEFNVKPIKSNNTPGVQARIGSLNDRRWAEHGSSGTGLGIGRQPGKPLEKGSSGEWARRIGNTLFQDQATLWTKKWHGCGVRMRCCVKNAIS
jgi:hypothetical protein